jgi:hypothetical protein
MTPASRYSVVIWLLVAAARPSKIYRNVTFGGVPFGVKLSSLSFIGAKDVTGGAVVVAVAVVVVVGAVLVVVVVVGGRVVVVWAGVVVVLLQPAVTRTRTRIIARTMVTFFIFSSLLFLFEGFEPWNLGLLPADIRQNLPP